MREEEETRFGGNQASDCHARPFPGLLSVLLLVSRVLAPMHVRGMEQRRLPGLYNIIRR